mgnify:CR=1 FL=1|jgi:hypothetical protein|tara:strand:- start:3624 stop:4226 length:603 start_codon:yes stop_codon:yes gene_type:complete
MAGVTSIDSLPTDPSVSAASIQNVRLDINEKPQVSFSQDTKQDNNIPNTLEQETVNNLVAGIQQASAAGVTQLPSRDIPMSQNSVHMDTQVDANYIPVQENIDYISNQPLEETYNEQMRRNNNKKDNLDVVYNELQVPILISLLFFLFNLPYFKKLLANNLKFLFKKDGNYNIYGFATSSLLFGLFYYILKSILNHFSSF